MKESAAGPDESPLYEPLSLQEWHDWLARNHTSSRGVWLVLQKKGSTRPGPRYEEAVEEAVAHGWIDSKARRLDEERLSQWYSPRRPGSVWSASNVARVERLLAAGRMTPAGLAAVEEAKRRGLWEQAQNRRAAAKMPPEMELALRRAHAWEAFQAFAPSYRELYTRWVLAARTTVTREKRIAQVVQNALAGRKPGGL